jgi:hypothetical protein
MLPQVKNVETPGSVYMSELDFDQDKLKYELEDIITSHGATLTSFHIDIDKNYYEKWTIGKSKPVICEGKTDIMLSLKFIDYNWTLYYDNPDLVEVLNAYGFSTSSGFRQTGTNIVGISASKLRPAEKANDTI